MACAGLARGPPVVHAVIAGFEYSVSVRVSLSLSLSLSLRLSLSVSVSVNVSVSVSTSLLSLPAHSGGLLPSAGGFGI